MSWAAGDVINTTARMRRLSQSIPSDYTVWKDGSTYRAECNIGGGTDYNGAAAGPVIQAALDAGGGVAKHKVVVRGDISLDFTDFAGNKVGIKVPSYSILDCSQAKLSIINAANTNADKTNFAIRTVINSHDIEIIGGELNGNKAGQAAANEIYGIETDAGSYNILVRDWYIHDTKETGIAFEGTSHRCWAINNRVITTDEDGIGNQYTAYDIWYINNYIDVGSGGSYGNLFIEGGLNINAIGNRLTGQTTRTPNGIKVTRGTTTAPISVRLEGNFVDKCLYGINVGDYVDMTTISGNHLYENDGDGIVLTGDNNRRINLVGNHAYNNDQAATGGHAGILLAGCQYCTVFGNFAYDNQVAPTQKHGIAETGAGDHNIIVGNTTMLNVTDGITTVGANTENHLNWNNSVWVG